MTCKVVTVWINTLDHWTSIIVSFKCSLAKL